MLFGLLIRGQYVSLITVAFTQAAASDAEIQKLNDKVAQLNIEKSQIEEAHPHRHRHPEIY